MISKYTERDSEKVSGELLFRGTRIPVYILFDYIEEGYTLDEFLVQYPSLTREQVRGFLRAVRHLCGAEVRAGE